MSEARHQRRTGVSALPSGDGPRCALPSGEEIRFVESPRPGPSQEFRELLDLLIGEVFPRGEARPVPKKGIFIPAEFIKR